MSAEELKENFRRLTMESTKVLEANDEVEAAYSAVCEAELEADAENMPGLGEKQGADIERTARECEQRTKQVKDLIKEALWSKFGQSSKRSSSAIEPLVTTC